jgi:hypothetical protein
MRPGAGLLLKLDFCAAADARKCALPRIQAEQFIPLRSKYFDISAGIAALRRSEIFSGPEPE